MNQPDGIKRIKLVNRNVNVDVENAKLDVIMYHLYIIMYHLHVITSVAVHSLTARATLPILGRALAGPAPDDLERRRIPDSVSSRVCEAWLLASGFWLRFLEIDSSIDPPTSPCLITFPTSPTISLELPSRPGVIEWTAVYHCLHSKGSRLESHIQSPDSDGAGSASSRFVR
jgi:hypothetical protein